MPIEGNKTMWVLLVWTISTANMYHPHQTLIAVSESDCRQMESFMNSVKDVSLNQPYKAECFKSRYN
jgi:hypothetical protein